MIRTSIKQILNLPLSLLRTNFSKNCKTEKIIISFPLPFHCFPSSQTDTQLNRNIERDQIPYFSIQKKIKLDFHTFCSFLPSSFSSSSLIFSLLCSKREALECETKIGLYPLLIFLKFPLLLFSPYTLFYLQPNFLISIMAYPLLILCLSYTF